ncbi:MAG: hypothetical protein IKR28_06255 [Selenomonadaceae bacterium]|nr:hypothetical protein [Selenomonadaceae bacterium]
MKGLNFAVGERFPLPIQVMGDGGMLQADVNGIMFILQLSKADIIAVEAFRTGKMELALYEQDGLLFFLYRIDGIFKEGWGDAPLGLHMLKKEQWPTERSLADPTLHLYLVDTNLQIILSLRQAAMNEVFFSKLKDNIRLQMEKPMTGREFSEAVRGIWGSLTPQQMREKAIAVQEVPLEIVKPGIVH